MFSKNFFLKISFGLLALSLLTCLFGCSLPLFESPPEQDPIVIPLGDSTACLSSVIPVIEQFISGDARDAQVTAAWDCLGASIQTFEKSVQGRYEDRFTNRELAHFIEQYFLEDNSRIPEVLLLEVFRIKQLFVGGEINSITRAEMKNLTVVIQELKQITLNINPYMKVFSFHWVVPSVTESDRQNDFFENANLAVQKSAKDLATVIARNGMPYQLDNIIVLVNELEAFGSSQWAWIPSVEKAMPLVKKLKKTLTGGEETTISPLEWHRFALLGARGFVQYLRYYYFIQSADFDDGGSELIYFTTSIDDLFSFLGDMVDGKPGQELKSDEVLEIFQALSQFVPNLKITKGLISEAMKVKVLFFGGRHDVFKKEDFDKAIFKLKSFKELAPQFLRFTKVYSLNWDPTGMGIGEGQAHFKSADANLVQFAKALGKNFESSYDLWDLVKLAKEIEDAYQPTTSDEKPSEVAAKYIPVLISAKNILLSDHGSVVGTSKISNQTPQEQWTQFLEMAAQFYSRYMYYDYFLKGQKVTEGRELYYLQKFVEDSIHNVNQLLSKKPQGLISFQEMDSFLKSMKGTGLLPAKLSINSLNRAVKILVERVLISPEKRLAGEIPKGFGPEAIRELQSEFGKWAQNQNFIDVIYQGIPVGVGKPGSQILADLNASANVENLLELKMIFTNPLPLSFDVIGRMYLSKPALNYRKSTTAMINLVRTGVRAMIRSYAMSLSHIYNYQGITQEEANTLFKDVRPIIVELDLLGPDNVTFAENRFRDANLFTAVGNGDDLVDFKEGANLFLMIVSGLKVDDLIFEPLEKSCRILKPTDSKTGWKVNANCARDLYHREISNTFGSMPDFLQFHHSLGKDRFEKMFANLLKATDAKVDTEGLVKIEDLALYAHLVQYIEGLFQMYDSNRDGNLATAEAMQAYPRYRGLLAKVSGLKDEKELRGLFAWLLKKGKPPAGLDQIYFKAVWCKMKEEEWKVSANREMLATILGFIAETMAEKPVPAPWF